MSSCSELLNEAKNTGCFSVKALFFKHKTLGLTWKKLQIKTSQSLSLLRSLVWDDRYFSSRKVTRETEVLY